MPTRQLEKRLDVDRLRFLNRLISDDSAWPDAETMLRELCHAFDVDAAGFRWPAEGPACFRFATDDVADPRIMYPLAIPDRPAGLFWIDADPQHPDMAWFQLVGNTLAHAPLLRKLFGYLWDQAKIAQRLKDAGAIAGRIAHDYDNILLGVGGFTTLAIELLDRDAPAVTNLQEVEKAVQAGTKFNQQLHQLSRAGTARPNPSTVSASVSREVERVRRAHPKLRIEMQIPNDLPSTAIDGAALSGVIGALLDNAVDASPPESGVIHVDAELVELAPQEAAAYLGLPVAGPNVRIRVSDRGPAIAQESMRRMFVEPFFTTKFRRRGLSLSAVFRTLYAHRGGARVESEAGRGTTVSVVVPLASISQPMTTLNKSTGGKST